MNICFSVQLLGHLLCDFVMLATFTTVYSCVKWLQYISGVWWDQITLNTLFRWRAVKITVTSFINLLWLAVIWLLGFITDPRWNMGHCWAEALLYCHYCFAVWFAKPGKYLQLINWETVVCGKLLNLSTTPRLYYFFFHQSVTTARWRVFKAVISLPGFWQNPTNSLLF